MSISSI